MHGSKQYSSSSSSSNNSSSSSSSSSSKQQATRTTSKKNPRATPTETLKSSKKTNPAPLPSTTDSIQHKIHGFRIARNIPGPSWSACEWRSGCAALTESWGGNPGQDTGRRLRKARSVRLRVRVGYPAERGQTW